MPYCSTCGTEISSRAVTCPSCGRPQAAMYTAPQRTDGQAITSLILGIVGLLMCPLIPSIFAVVIGNQAKGRLAADPTLQGEELARVGVILGWIGIALGSIGVAIAVFAFVFSFGALSIGP
jgi:hypothetical protein